MGHQDNAMTEIALALAMGFFSIMVLTMVSMGATGHADTTDPATDRTMAAHLAPASENAPAAQAVTPRDLFIVYVDGRFFDDDLQPFDVASIGDADRVVLALEPGLPLEEALKVRNRVSHDNLIVAALDRPWLDTLQRLAP